MTPQDIYISKTRKKPCSTNNQLSLPIFYSRYYLQRSTPSSNFSKEKFKFRHPNNNRLLQSFFFDRFGFVFCSIARHDNEFYVFFKQPSQCPVLTKSHAHRRGRILGASFKFTKKRNRNFESVQRHC